MSRGKDFFVKFWILCRRVISFLKNPKTIFEQVIVNYFSKLGFLHAYRYVIHGPPERLHLGKGVSLGHNQLYNTRSGHIFIGDGTKLSHNCMLLTGRHEFKNGKLVQPKSSQVPTEGYDITIGSGCWIASGAIISGGVTIGDNCIVTAGAVVTQDFRDGCIVGGVPAKIIKYTDSGEYTGD